MKRRMLLALLMLTVSSASAMAEEIINPQEIVIQKLNSEAGADIIKQGQSAAGKRKSKVKKSEENNINVTLPPSVVLSRFLQADAVITPTTAKIEKEKKPKKSYSLKTNTNQARTGVLLPRKTTTKTQEKHWRGYCYFDRDIIMTTATMPVDVECAFQNGEDGVLHATLMIDPKSFTLLMKPDYLTINKKDYTVYGYVMTSDKSSINVADEVNKQFLKRVLTAMASEGATATLNAYKQYAQSKYSTTYLAGDTVVTDTQYPSNYPLVMGILGMIDGAVRSVTSIIQAEMGQVPAIFKIHKGKTVYVDLTTRKTKFNVGGSIPSFATPAYTPSTFTQTPVTTSVYLPSAASPTTSSSTTATTTATTSPETTTTATTSSVTSNETETEKPLFQSGQIATVECYFNEADTITPVQQSTFSIAYPPRSATAACSTTDASGRQHSLTLYGKYSFDPSSLTLGFVPILKDIPIKVYFTPSTADADDGNTYEVSTTSPVYLLETKALKDNFFKVPFTFSIKKTFNIIVKGQK